MKGEKKKEKGFNWIFLSPTFRCKAFDFVYNIVSGQ